MLWVTWSWGMIAAQSSLVDSSKLLNLARTADVVIRPPKLPEAAGSSWLTTLLPPSLTPAERPALPVLAGERHPPRLGAVGVDGDVYLHRLDDVDDPSLGGAGPDLCLRHPSGTPIAGLPVAEAQHEVAAAGGEGCPKSL